MNARSFSSSVISIRRLYVLESRFSSVSRGDNLARKDLCHMVGALRRPLLGESRKSCRAAALDVARETRARCASPRSHASRTGGVVVRSKRLGARGCRPGAG